jgi:hypothetical protein
MASLHICAHQEGSSQHATGLMVESSRTVHWSARADCPPTLGAARNTTEKESSEIKFGGIWPVRHPVPPPASRVCRRVWRAPVAVNSQPAHDRFMRVVVTSNDPVRLSFLTVLLADAGIETVLLDTHSSITEGSAGAIPRRLVVAEDNFARARSILREAGEW